MSTTFQKRGRGWLKDKPDARDHSYSAKRTAGAVASPDAHLRKYILDILDQGSEGSCVANSLAQNVRMSHVRQGAVNPPLLSRNGLYYLARAVTGDQHQDTGTYTRNACAALVKFGFAPESVWPYDDNTKPGPNGELPKFAQMPPAEFFRQGFDQKAKQTAAGVLPAYLRITETGTDRIAVIRHALASGFGVSFGTLVSEAFCAGETDSTKALGPPINEQIAGGHELLITDSWTMPDGSFEFSICNSWSKDWGDGGFFRMRTDYVKWSETDDLWIVEAPPLYSTELSS